MEEEADDGQQTIAQGTAEILRLLLTSFSPGGATAHLPRFPRKSGSENVMSRRL